MVERLPTATADSENMLATARMILAVALNPRRPFDVPEIAMETGLTYDTVRQILASPEYAELMNREIRTLVTTTLTKGVSAMDKIIANEKSTDANKVSALRAVVHTFQAMTQTTKTLEQQSPKSDELEQFQEALRQMRKGQTP